MANRRSSPTFAPVCNPGGLLGIPSSSASTESANTPSVSQNLLTILNPPAGFPGFVGVKHATRWIRQGRAVMVGDEHIKLLDKHRRALANSRNSRGESALGYDAVRRMLTQSEKRRLPIAQPPERPTKRKPVAVHARPGLVRFRYDHQLTNKHAVNSQEAV